MPPPPRFAPSLVSALLLLSTAETARADDLALSVEVQGGFFGLFNLNRTYTDAEPGFGAIVAFEGDVHRYFAVGGEWGMHWVRSVRGRSHRLTMGPQLRARFQVELEAGFSFFLVAATGLAIWPEDDAEPDLDLRLRATRLGWSLRVSGGVEYALDPTWTLFVALGYSATSTYDDALSATIDNMLVSVGSRARF